MGSHSLLQLRDAGTRPGVSLGDQIKLHGTVLKLLNNINCIGNAGR